MTATKIDGVIWCSNCETDVFCNHREIESVLLSDLTIATDWRLQGRVDVNEVLSAPRATIIVCDHCNNEVDGEPRTMWECSDCGALYEDRVYAESCCAMFCGGDSSEYANCNCVECSLGNSTRVDGKLYFTLPGCGDRVCTCVQCHSLFLLGDTVAMANHVCKQKYSAGDKIMHPTWKAALEVVEARENI